MATKPNPFAPKPKPGDAPAKPGAPKPMKPKK